LARALYHRSNLIFLDEPTASIDSEGGALLISDLLCLRDEITIVMITHDKNNLQYFDRCYELTEDGLIKI
jgi:ABC-type lipoprotein export system ATPase subunit